MANNEDYGKILKQVHESCIRTEENVKSLVKTKDDHEKRIRHNERFKQNVVGWVKISKAVGGITGITALVTFISKGWH